MLGLAGLVLALAGPVVPDTDAAPPQDQAVAIQTEGPPSCAEESLIRPRLAAYLATSRADALPQAVTVTVVVEQTEPTVEATLSLTTPEGHSSRTLQAGTCAELVDAIALLAAMTVDPLLEIDATEPVDASESDPVAPEPVPEPEPEPEPAPEPEAEPLLDPPGASVEAALAPATPTRSLSGLAWAAGGIAGGLLPSVGGVMEAGGGVQWRWLRAMAVANVQFPRTEPVETGTIVLSAWGLGAHGCYVPNFGRFELAACAVAEAGQVLGIGRGFADETTDRRPWVAVGLRGAASVQLTAWLLLSLEAQLVVHALQPQFTVTGASVGRTTQLLGGRGIAGLQFRLPWRRRGT